jgi:glutathione peroxidase
MSKGLEILAFPCNQFMRQEPGTDEQIEAFARGFGAKFRIFSKVKVNGKEASDLYKYLRLNSNLKGETIGWNFGKFLVDRNGVIIKYYGTRTNPLEIEPDIIKLL